MGDQPKSTSVAKSVARIVLIVAGLLGLLIAYSNASLIGGIVAILLIFAAMLAK